MGKSIELIVLLWVSMFDGFQLCQECLWTGFSCFFWSGLYVWLYDEFLFVFPFSLLLDLAKIHMYD